MIRSLPCLLLAATAAAADPPQRRTDLAALRSTLAGPAEAARLAGCDGEKCVLRSYQLLRCPQADGSPELHLLLASQDWNFGSGVADPDAYDDQDLEPLFGGASRADLPTATFSPSLAPVTDAEVIVFDDQGHELRPFGGDNFIDPGHVCDFNGDGVLERADATSYLVEEADGHTIEAFELRTVERQPRTLLEVIFNWHPRSADDANEWTFHCFDEDDDGRVEIGFGPRDAGPPPEGCPFVFRWDPERRQYQVPAIPERAHIRVVAPGETYAGIARAGGLDYPLLDRDARPGDPLDPFADPPAAESPAAPYAFESLKGATDEALSAFFAGRSRRDFHDGPEDAPPTRLPERFWSREPRDAALSLAEANRSPSHRRAWRLAVDDRDNATPPDSGWLVHDWGSSSCYSYSSHLIALRFGVPSPMLVVLEYSSIGVVGRNPWADQPAHSARRIPLEPEEARFLADTVFWLDRVRSWAPGGGDEVGGMFSSTADGFATLEVHPSGAPPEELAASTVWATRGISSRWAGAYDRTVLVNLVEHLLGTALPRRLGPRWQVAPELDHPSLVTPIAERVAERVDDDARQQLEQTLAAILELDPPARVVRELARTAGSEALVGLLPALEALERTLPPPGDEDAEFERLERRFARDHFGNRLNEAEDDEADARERLESLRSARRFHEAAILRQPLADAVESLRLASNPAHLMQEVIDEGPRATWALGRLRRADPGAWAGLLEEQFRSEGVEGRRSILRTLAAVRPEAARRVIDRLRDGERRDLILEIVEFHQHHQPDALAADLPVLMELVRKREANYIRRCGAMETLAGIKLPPPECAELTRLLVDEIASPQQGEYGMDTRRSAIVALGGLPTADDHLEALARAEADAAEFAAALEALVELTAGRDDRDQWLSTRIAPRLEESDGMMNEVFLACLALDLRSFAPALRKLASEGPTVPDGDGANYSGGGFKSPRGHHYHLAREVVALWSERDPVTRGRMWIFLAAARPFEFNRDSAVTRALRQRAATAILALPRDQRQRTIESALARHPVPQRATDTATWLRSLH